MSNFKQQTKHPITGKVEEASWLDNHFGNHHYGVVFPSEPHHVYDEDLVSAQSSKEDIEDEKFVSEEDMEQFLDS